MTPLESLLKTKLPRCLDGVRVTAVVPPEPRDCTTTEFSIAPKAVGDFYAQVLGYRLQDYNPTCESDRDVIAPLTLRWPDGAESCVFDSAIHGYHGEMGSSSKFRGHGAPVAFTCEECDNSGFLLTVQFDYGGACDDLLEDEPDAQVQDYFSGIVFSGSCAMCGKVNRILAMDL